MKYNIYASNQYLNFLPDNAKVRQIKNKNILF